MAAPRRFAATTVVPVSSSASPALAFLQSIVSPVLLGTALGGAALFTARKLRQRKNRTSSKLQLTNQQQKEALQEIFPRLCTEFISDVRDKYAFPEFALQRLQRLFDYNIQGGKYWRATLVLNTVQKLSIETGCDIESKWEQALVLGWCIEILQALFLVADDMMDGSQTRRKKPCWYLVPDVKNDAINDTLILESFMWFLLNKYFRDNSYQHIAFLELFQSVSYQTQMGQMLDLLSQPQGRRDPELLKDFTLENYHRIVTFKTAIYTFYLSIAAGMVLCGLSSPAQLASARAIAIELGKKFQIEDDYLDCYGLPEKIGKDGTDIKDHKCSWLIVQALQRVTPEQRKIIEDNYGRDGAQEQATIKQLYRELGLETIYLAEEDASRARILQLIKDNEHILPANLFEPILNLIHNRDH